MGLGERRRDLDNVQTGEQGKPERRARVSKYGVSKLHPESLQERKFQAFPSAAHPLSCGLCCSSLQSPVVRSVRSETRTVVNDVTYDKAVLKECGLAWSFSSVPFSVLPAECMVSLDLVSRSGGHLRHLTAPSSTPLYRRQRRASAS